MDASALAPLRIPCRHLRKFLHKKRFEEFLLSSAGICLETVKGLLSGTGIPLSILLKICKGDYVCQLKGKQQILCVAIK